MKHKFIVERTDGTTNRVEAEICECVNGVIRFYDIVEGDYTGLNRKTKTISIYPFQSVVCVTPYEGDEENSNEEPERQENTNNDLISRSGLLNFLRTHWSYNVIEVIETFEKVKYLD